MRNSIRTLVTLALTAILALAAVSALAATDVNLLGVYTYTDTQVGFSEVVKGKCENMLEYNRLTLFTIDEGKTFRNESNAYAWQPGNNYELVKTLSIGDTGMHVYQSYFGTFTGEGDSVTLETPAYYSYYIFFGNCASDETSGYMFKDQVGVGLLTANNEYYTTNGASGDRDGLYDFNNPIADYHHPAGGETAFSVKLNADGTYEYASDDDDE